jgi:hypothetical protein
MLAWIHRKGEIIVVQRARYYSSSASKNKTTKEILSVTSVKCINYIDAKLGKTNRQRPKLQPIILSTLQDIKKGGG